MTVAERIARGPFVSFELWPPRSEESAAALEDALADPVELTGTARAQVATLVTRIEQVAADHPQAATYAPGPVL